MVYCSRSWNVWCFLLTAPARYSVACCILGGCNLVCEHGRFASQWRALHALEQTTCLHCTALHCVRVRTQLHLLCLTSCCYVWCVQVCGYDGPVFMTHPTRAIAPLMLQDYHK